MIETLDILFKYREAFLSGLWVTLQLCLVIWFLGIICGTALGMAAARWRRIMGTITRSLSFFFSAVPVLVFLFWLHYPFQKMIGIVINPFFTAAAALSLLNTLSVADIIHQALKDFPEEYIIAAKVCGLSPYQTVSKIQLPLILRRVLPVLLLVQVNMLQATLFASLISVDEIFRTAQRINAIEYKPIEIYTALAIFFVVVCAPLNGFALWLKHRFTRDTSES